MKAAVPGWHRRVPNDRTAEALPSVLDRDRLGRFFPALLVLSAVAGALEGASAVIFGSPALAVSTGATCVFAIGVIVAVHRIRSGHPGQARVALAVSLTILCLLGAVLIPGIGPATALLPIVSVVLVLPHVPRDRLVPVFALAIGSAVAVLILDQLPHPLPGIAGTAGIVFQDGILIGVVVLVLAGVADFAMDARDSTRDLREASERQLQASAERLAIVGSLRSLRAQGSPEATATGIVQALSDLPVAAVAVILEETDGGLVVLAAAGESGLPVP